MFRASGAEQSKTAPPLQPHSNAIDITTCTSTGTSTSMHPRRSSTKWLPAITLPLPSSLAASLERQLGPRHQPTLTYLHSFGVHQLVTRNANQATGGTPQNSSGGYLYEYYPEAVFKQNQLIASVNAKVNKNLNLVGFYTLSLPTATETAALRTHTTWTRITGAPALFRATCSSSWPITRSLGYSLQSVLDCAVGPAVQHHAGQPTR